jgi:hypothetical protein
MMFTNLINGEDVFTELGQAWDKLARDGMTDTPFQKFAYQHAWCHHLHQ